MISSYITCFRGLVKVERFKLIMSSYELTIFCSYKYKNLTLAQQSCKIEELFASFAKSSFAKFRSVCHCQSVCSFLISWISIASAIVELFTMKEFSVNSRSVWSMQKWFCNSASSTPWEMKSQTEMLQRLLRGFPLTWSLLLHMFTSFHMLQQISFPICFKIASLRLANVFDCSSVSYCNMLFQFPHSFNFDIKFLLITSRDLWWFHFMSYGMPAQILLLRWSKTAIHSMALEFHDTLMFCFAVSF